MAVFYLWWCRRLRLLKGSRYGSNHRTVLRTGCPQGRCGRVCIGRKAGGKGTQGDPHLWNNNNATGTAAGLASPSRLHAHRHGIDGCVLVEAQASDPNRLQRLLETCNVKLASVATDVFGKSGREMLRALIKGEESPEQMAQLARGRLRKKLEQLVLAFHGKVESHHRFMLEMQLGRVEDIEANIAIVDSKIDEALTPHRAVMERLMTIPGVDRVVAVTVIAELGIDMNVFPTTAHAAAWGGVCPGNNESAGKRMGQQKRRGNVHLATALVQAAMGASKTKDTYLKARFWKIAGRAGKKRAAVAVAHSILNAIYHMLKGSVDYKDLGCDYLDRFLHRRAEQRLVQRLRSMGYEVRPKTP